MGKSLLVMEGLSGAALIDAKEYPSRSVGEPPDGGGVRPLSVPHLWEGVVPLLGADGLRHAPGRLPSWLDFLSSPEPAALSLLSQLLVVEFLIDVLKLASLNTPDTLSNSFSMLGALILGDFAVQAGWLGPEVLVYMAFVSVAGFAQPSYELGYAFKLLRVALLLLYSGLRRLGSSAWGSWAS